MHAGMTERPAEQLLPLMRSWSDPPALRFTGGGAVSEGYDRALKAYSCAARRTISAPRWP
jgi:hypothetical protein